MPLISLGLADDLCRARPLPHPRVSRMHNSATSLHYSPITSPSPTGCVVVARSSLVHPSIGSSLSPSFLLCRLLAAAAKRSAQSCRTTGTSHKRASAVRTQDEGLVREFTHPYLYHCHVLATTSRASSFVFASRALQLPRRNHGHPPARLGLAPPPPQNQFR